MLTYRNANNKDLKEINKIFTEAFLDYEMFTAFEPDRKRRRVLVQHMQTLGIMTDIRRRQLFVAEDEGRIVAVTSIHFPDIKQAGVFDYIKEGALSALIRCGVRKTLGWFEMYSACVKPCGTVEKPVFYVEDLAVRPGCQGKGYGSRVIQELLIPVVRKKGGGTLTLITNNEKNAAFYEKNGFICFSKGRYKKGRIDIGNWCFKMRVL